MTDKQIIIYVCPYQGECSVSGCKRNDDGCFVRQLFEERNRAENRIVELNKSIQAKEQECERLRFPMKDSNYAILTKEEFEQLDQLKEQLEAYKMEAEEGKEINAELKKELEQEKNWHKTSDEISKVNSEYTEKIKQTLTEIKEIAEDAKTKVFVDMEEFWKQILQKISEVEDE